MAKNNLAKVGFLNIQNGNHVQMNEQSLVFCLFLVTSDHLLYSTKTMMEVNDKIIFVV